MAQKQTLADKLLARIGKLEIPGLSKRKAQELAKELAPTAARQKVSGTVTGKLTDKLMKLGLSERKATELAKGLAPTVRSAIKAKAKAAQQKLDDVTDDDVNETVSKSVDEADDKELDKVAPKVNGHRVRLDLPVVGLRGIKGIELLRVVDGLTTRGTYLVSAVQGETAMVAVRKFNDDYFKVKFYPTMAAWNRTPEGLEKLGCTDYLDRRGENLYERVMVSRQVLDKVMSGLAKDAKPKSRMKALFARFQTVTAAPLVKAFEYLHKRRSVAA